MVRKYEKVCLVCGGMFLGTEGAQTCGSGCRTKLSRLKKESKEPKFYGAAKSNGQKVPQWVSATPKPKIEERLLTYREQLMKIKSGS